MSVKQYHTVTLTQIQEVLSKPGWQLVTEPTSKEFIFEFPLSTSPEIVIRVCTSITESGISRGRGKDAIRVYAFNKKTNKGYIKTKRVYRIGTWEKNLKNAVWECFNNAKERRDRFA